MKIINGVENFNNKGANVLALGNFDGVHTGHQRLIKRAIDDAHSRQGYSIVMVFDPHPMRLLAPSRSPKLLTTTEQKAAILKELGLDCLLLTPFTRDIAGWTPAYFVEKILLETIGVSAVYVGYNYTFGSKASGNAEMLAEFGKQYGFAVHVMEPVKVNGKTVSSSLVRSCLAKGDIAAVRAYTGRLPFLEGTVIAGDQRGGTALGFPTANLSIPAEMAMPGIGVYAGRALVEGKPVEAVINIGRLPTFFEDHAVTVETHLLDFSRDIYGQTVRVELLSKLRDEMKFDGIDALKAQISRDITNARAVLNDA